MEIGEHECVWPIGSVSVVIPAAGTGTRMKISHGETEKQFVSVLGRPVISYTISVFENLPIVSCIAVVVLLERRKLMEEIRKKFNHKKVIIVTGSTTRHRSIYEGVKAIGLEEKKPDIIIVHDAVRPLVRENDIMRSIHFMKKHQAVGLSRPLVSTVLEIDSDNKLVKSLDRNAHRASEMPQTFHYDVLKAAYENCSEYDLDHGTECLHLVHKYTKTEVVLLDGPDYLWKITYKKDLETFENILREDGLEKWYTLKTSSGYH